MSTSHVAYELKVSKTNTYTSEAIVQFLSTLPDLHNYWWDHLLQRFEHMSLEIHVKEQRITFVLYCPERVADYTISILTAAYPDVHVTKLDHDPLFTTATEQPRHYTVGSLVLSNGAALPLKTYRDFSQTDPLMPLVATLSQLKAQDHAVIQYVISRPNHYLSISSVATTTTPHPQQALIDMKKNQQACDVALRILVGAETKQRSVHLLETIAQTFQAITKSESNSLVLKRAYFFPDRLKQKILERSFGFFDTQHFSVDELATVFHLPTPVIASIPNIAWGRKLLGEPPENLPVITAQTPAEEKKDINAFARTIYKNVASVYGIHRVDRRRHMYVIGKTGTGKSTLLANMAISDLKNDEGMCVIDPHGDLVETLLNYIPSRRINDVIYFDPSDPEKTVQINLFEGTNIVHRELIASGIVSVFRKLYAYSWGPRLEYILRNALLTLLKSETARLSDIIEMLTNKSFRQKLVAQLDDDILKNFWEQEFDTMQDKLRTEAIAPILNKVGQFVSSPLVRDVVNSRYSSFSIEEAMDSGKIILVNLSQGKLGEDNATLLGAMLITKIQLAAMARVHIPEEERRDFYLYVDEFQNFATESFTKILSEARKYRLDLILANQYMGQIPEDVQKAIFGNCGSIVSFVTGSEDAGVLAREFNNRYTADELVSLGKHQIVNKITINNMISEPFPAETLPLAKSSNKNKDKVVKVSRERYAANKK